MQNFAWEQFPHVDNKVYLVDLTPHISQIVEMWRFE